MRRERYKTEKRKIKGVCGKRRWEKKLLKRDEQEEMMVTLKTAGGDGLQKPESSCAKEYSKVHLMRLQRPSQTD